MKKISTIIVVAALAGCATEYKPGPLQRAHQEQYRKGAAEVAKMPVKLPHANNVKYKLGIAGYTFAACNLDKALDIMQKVDCHYLCHKSGFLPYTATDQEIAEFKAKLAAAGVQCVATGPLYTQGKTIEDRKRQLDNQFSFAKRYGLKVVVGVPTEKNPKIAFVDDEDSDSVEAGYAILPVEQWNLESDEVLDYIDTLVKKYDIKYAIHNHGPDNAYLYPTAEAALKRIGNRDKRIGVCLDVGHEMRAGINPVDCIRKYSDRIYDVHIKNIKVNAKYNCAKQGPRGELDMPAIFQALKDVGYAGGCHVEYEANFSDNIVPVAESVGYYRGCIDSLK